MWEAPPRDLPPPERLVRTALPDPKTNLHCAAKSAKRQHMGLYLTIKWSPLDWRHEST